MVRRAPPMQESLEPVADTARRLVGSVSRAMVAIALAATLSACEQSFFLVESFVVPERAALDAHGTLDLAFAEEYVATVLLRNVVADPDPNGSDGIRVEGANVRIWLGGTPEGEPAFAFYQPAPGYVAEGESEALPFAAVPAQAIDAIAGQRLGGPWSELSLEERLAYSDLVTIGVRMLGTTVGGSEVETPEAYLSIHLCFACLVACTQESRGDEMTSFAFCLSVEPVEDEPERLGQDQPIDCRLCVPSYGWEVCQAWCSLAG